MIDAWKHDRERTRRAYARRGLIESTFANATSFGDGLSPLLAWVRWLDRVRRWLAAS